MAGILNRFKDIMSANINALLDKVENPMKMIDQYLRNLENDLNKVKSETASVMAEESRLQRELNECEESINKYQTYAEKALLAGNESDAKQFLNRKKQISERLEMLKKSYEIAKSNSEKMRAMHDKLISDIGELNTRRNELKAKVALAETQEKLNKIGTSVDGAMSNMSKFGKMEAKINKKIDEANAMQELNSVEDESNIDKLVEKYDGEGEGSFSEIDNELEELKSKLGVKNKENIEIEENKE